MSQEIINRVASSQLVSLDLEELIPDGDRVEYDLKNNLYEGLILREKEFRTYLKERDWSEFEGKHVAIYCSSDAIIPRWAYMLLTTKIAPYARTIYYGNLAKLENDLLIQAVRSIKQEDFIDKKVIIKGCGEKEISEAIYMEITSVLLPVVSSIMYGEPCSTVPVYKKPINKA